MKKSTPRFDQSYLNTFNFVKSFLTNSYWHILNIAQKRNFFFNSQYKTLFGMSNFIKFFNFSLLKHVSVRILYLLALLKKKLHIFFLIGF
jgi:hypothetical protein